MSESSASPRTERSRRVHGAGEMADRIRQKDWSATPLGPLSLWSEAFVATVNLALSASETFAIYYGPEHTLLYNDEYRKLLYAKHPDALGKPGTQVWGEAWSVIGPQIHNAFTHGVTTTVSEALIPILVDGQMKDGWYTYSFHPIYDGDYIVAVANPGRDDSSAVLARTAAKQSADRLNQVLETTTDAVFSLDRNWTFTYLNGNAKRLLAPYGDLIGRNLWASFPDTQYEDSPFIREYTRSMDDRLPGEFETYYPLPEGWFQVISQPAPDGITVFFRDITASKKSVGALIESEKLAAVGRLAASIAHEINNPLEAVTNLIYLAKTADSVDEIREHLEMADHELRRVAAITNQTLRFHKQATNPTEIAPQDLLESVLTIYHGRLLAADVVIERRDHAHQPICCFEGEIRQVLSNLVGNAIDSMSSGRRCLLLRTREGHEWSTGKAGIVFTVADSGSGMTPATLARVFEAFYTTKGFTGTGLGLWVSKEIVERHQGFLRARSSQREGRAGTVFTLFLPFQATIR